MSKPRALALCCGLAALPLFGCAGGPGGQSQAYARPATAANWAEGAYAAAPTALVVVLPGDPAVWAAPEFDVASPAFAQLAADHQAAFDRMMASAQAMAGAPAWLLGASPAIAAALASLPAAGPGQVSGVVVTSASSGAGTCSQRMIYSYSGNGAAPKVAITKSGNACPPGLSIGAAPNNAPSAPSVRPQGPRLIEAASPGEAGPPAAQRAMTRHVVDLVKSPPQS